MFSPGIRAILCRLAVLLLAFSPALLCGYFVASNAVNVPVSDDWSRATLLKKGVDGELGFADLYAAESGARPLVPRLLMLVSNGLTGGNLRAEIAIAHLSLWVTAACLFFLVAKTLPSGPWRVVTCLALAMAVFSPVQYENLLWAARLGTLLPVACLAICLAALRSTLPTPAKAALCALMAAAGMHSAPAGLLIWPAVLFVIGCGLSGQERRWLFAGISLLAAALCAAYLPGSGFGIGSGSSHSFLSGLGSPLARSVSTDASATAPLVGRILLVLFAGELAILGWRWSDPHARAALLPWAALGGYAVASAALLAFGPSPAAAAEAIWPRNASAGLLLSASLVGTGAYLLNRWATRTDTATLAARLALCAAFGGTAIAIWWPGWVHGARKMEQWKSARLQGRAALMYWAHREVEFPGRLDDRRGRLEGAIPFLQAQGWLDPAPLEQFGFGGFIRDEKRMAPSDYKHAMIRDATFDGGVLRTRGYAALPASLRAADAVLLTWRTGKGEPWQALALTEVRGQSVSEMIFGDTHYGMGPNLARPKQFSKWGVEHSWPDAPEVEFELRAWMLDAEKMRAYPLGGGRSLGGGSKAEEGGDR